MVLSLLQQDEKDMHMVASRTLSMINLFPPMNTIYSIKCKIYRQREHNIVCKLFVPKMYLDWNLS